MALLRLRWVHRFRDRHGHVRHYFRRPGFPRVALPGLPGSPEFMRAYEMALADAPAAPPSRHAVGTIGALVEDYLTAPEFRNLKPNSQELYRRVLDDFVRAHGHRIVREMQHKHARAIVQKIGDDRPAMANVSRSILRLLMQHAIAIGLRVDNPFANVPSYRLGTHHTWTEGELVQFEAHWPLGTRQRLAFDMLLYSAQRGGDVVKLTRANLRDGVIMLRQQKTGTELVIPIHPALARSIAAGPSKGLALIADVHGRPITRGSLTRLIASAAKAADLPAHCKAHGLRKAAARRLAEAGATSKEIQSITGHGSLKEVERYSAKADQARLAQAAMRRLDENANRTKTGNPTRKNWQPES